MIKEEPNDRPDCAQILEEKEMWAFNLDQAQQVIPDFNQIDYLSIMMDKDSKPSTPT